MEASSRLSSPRFRARVARHIVEFIPKTEEGSTLRVNVDLQDNFSMDQTLSLYLLETIPLLDPESPDYRPFDAAAPRGADLRPPGVEAAEQVITRDTRFERIDVAVFATSPASERQTPPSRGSIEPLPRPTP